MDALEQMRRRFHELGAQREAILAQSGPLRAERDKLVQEHEAKVRPLEKQYLAIEKPLYDIDQERAALARALQGKTGPAPDAAK